MAGSEPTPRELQAGEVVAERVGGTLESRDGSHAAPGMYDFDIHLPDGRVIALEVTTIADFKVVGFHNLMGDTMWVAPELNTDWWVALPDPEGGQPVIKIKRSKPTMVSALAALEAHGITQLEPDMLDRLELLPESTPPVVREGIKKLSAMGIRLVYSTGQRSDDVAQLLFSAHGSASGNPDQLNDLVLERVEAKREKLAAGEAAEASQRHLFIWLTDSYPDAELAFSTMTPPAPPPIPSIIDVVWLARFAWPIRLWRLRPPGGWELVDAGR
jgi:hypothetical protein